MGEIFFFFFFCKFCRQTAIHENILREHFASLHSPMLTYILQAKLHRQNFSSENFPLYDMKFILYIRTCYQLPKLTMSTNNISKHHWLVAAVTQAKGS